MVLSCRDSKRNVSPYFNAKIIILFKRVLSKFEKINDLCEIKNFLYYYRILFCCLWLIAQIDKLRLAAKFSPKYVFRPVYNS